jgi:Asp-tRNA(Asn)/Glu-tRNA(Gln) amidotransferase A subunit family amidase
MRDDGFFDLSIRTILQGYTSGAITPREVAQICCDQVEKYDPQYLAMECFDPETLFAEAAGTQKYLESGRPIRALEGIPIGVKDIFNTADFPTQMGSPIWANFTPGNDARAVFHLKRAGAIIPGKTVTAEFAVHTLRKTLNPHDITRTPGTSSSGSAVAIATGMFPVSLGTQTAGSIVRPASFCGVFGCKPSFGLIPRTGMLKTTDSLDTVGFFVLHLDDMETVFDVLRVHGPDYPLSHAALSDADRQSKPAARPWRLALVPTYTWQAAPPYAQEALCTWAEALAKDADIDLVWEKLPTGMEHAHDIHATIYNKTLAYYFQNEFKQKQLVSPIMHELIAAGNRIAPRQYQQALKEQEKLAHLMEVFFREYDVLISLSTAGEAPLRDDRERCDPSLIWTMTHLPVISAPVFTSPSGGPFGVQLAARRYNDRLLFKFANYLGARDFIPRTAHPRITQRGLENNIPHPGRAS